MATSPFSNVPHDILIAILTQLRGISETNEPLISCCLVNRRFYEATTPLLYGNIALNTKNVKRFCAHLGPSQYDRYVRSITLSFQRWQNLEQPTQWLASTLPYFEHLRSFSFWIGNEFYGTFPQRVLVRLVDALPVSCVNLEIDTRGCDVRDEDESHLCDSLRKILPRMEHVRLRQRGCEALFADPSTPETPIRMPKLKTFIYSCVDPHGTRLGRCDGSTAKHPRLWHTITASLERLVAVPDAVSKDAKIYAFISTDSDHLNSAVWTYIRADIQAQSSLAMPHRGIWNENGIPGSHLIRMADGSELMGTYAQIDPIAEGRLWRKVVGGVRLPAAVLADERAGRASFATGCVEDELGYLKTSQQWREENPGKSTSHWFNGEDTGMRLVEAEERRGKEDYLALRPILETTPPGSG